MGSPLANQIAVAAAQLVAEDGMEYAQAKRKAAKAIVRQSRSVELPSNEEVEDEVRAHIALFQADSQPTELAALRALALDWMERLAEYRPHLAGAVWRGTANRHSAIHIDLYCSDSKSAEIDLINRHISFETDLHTDERGRDFTVLSLSDRCPGMTVPVTLHLRVRDLDDVRGALRPDARGATWRGDARALQQLMAADPATVPGAGDGREPQ